MNSMFDHLPFNGCKQHSSGTTSFQEATTVTDSRKQQAEGYNAHGESEQHVANA
jgi:hypothetical protein